MQSQKPMDLSVFVLALLYAGQRRQLAAHLRVVYLSLTLSEST